ncbi:MAG TPA: ABC transporter ATP-binding protein [Bacteroidia bacterium]|jgi:lipopolysaccharide transport system ATP-binding protein|nr:ABC transporter ATP-binding protein [Bacteroidia bacterium]
MSTVIKVENISKLYQLKDVGMGTFASDVTRWWAGIRGKEDPAFKLAETNDRAQKGTSDFVWALKDINFELKQGEVLGILGKNGSGKSTLFKIMSRVAAPTTGIVKMKGRLASLLEVGTGFHPDFSGKENIFMNGAILGMNKAEIKKKYDEIVEFSGIGRYIDTPVKRYSSGMYVRLAFAVAAHLESEILIVDEVLAVGDIEFQKKCLGKMKDVSGAGRTVLFVSHNPDSIQKLTETCLLLENGINKCYGTTADVLREYLPQIVLNHFVEFNNKAEAIGNENVKIKSVRVLNAMSPEVDISQELVVEIAFWNDSAVDEMMICFDVYHESGALVFGTSENYFKIKNEGVNTLRCYIPANFLNDEIYHINLMFYTKDFHALYNKHEIIAFQIKEFVKNRKFEGKVNGLLRPKLKWEVL